MKTRKNLGLATEKTRKKEEKQKTEPAPPITEEGNATESGGVEHAKKEPTTLTAKPEKVAGNDTIPDNNGEMLPKTATHTYNILLAGLILVIAGGIMYYVRKRKKYS